MKPSQISILPHTGFHHGSAEQAKAGLGMPREPLRVGVKLGNQKREQKEAEGGVKGALGLSSDEAEDEREVWSVGRVEVEGTFNTDG